MDASTSVSTPLLPERGAIVKGGSLGRMNLFTRLMGARRVQKLPLIKFLETIRSLK
jgi:hypothetical protein